MNKRVIVHLGPHKTGSTTIQKSLVRHRRRLAELGVGVLHDDETHRVSLLLAAEQYEHAEVGLSHMSREISLQPEATVILSQEDFSGELPGKSRRKQVYPKLLKNMRVIHRALRAHDVSFVFYIRDEEPWLRSCFIQNIKHRTRFSSLEQFLGWFDGDFSWSNKLQKPQETFGPELVTIRYVKDPKAGFHALLEAAGVRAEDTARLQPVSSENSSPVPEVVAQLEHINRVTEFPRTAWFAKQLVQSGYSPKRVPSSAISFREWPPAEPDPAAFALPALSRRVLSRVHSYRVSDVLPPHTVDLEACLQTVLPSEATLPDASRQRMEDQVDILRYHLRGKTELAFLNALAISYLRRDTEFTEKARGLFHRIWDEQGPMLINELSTRWLISTLQTFMDHGKTEAQRQIGTTGYFYANILKIYEGERALEGVEQSKFADARSPQTKNEFRGLDRFSLGGTDLMLNTNALALEVAFSDDAAGLVLQEFLLRVKSAANVFTRLDAARAAANISVAGFGDTWSFFEPKH